MQAAVAAAVGGGEVEAAPQGAAQSRSARPGGAARARRRQQRPAEGDSQLRENSSREAALGGVTCLGWVAAGLGRRERPHSAPC